MFVLIGEEIKSFDGLKETCLSVNLLLTQFAERTLYNDWIRHRSSCVCLFLWVCLGFCFVFFGGGWDLFSFLFVSLGFCSEGKCSSVEKVNFYPREQCWPMVLLWRKVKHLLDNLPNVDLNYCRMNAPLLFSQWIKALKTLCASVVLSLPLLRLNFFWVNSGNTTTNSSGFGVSACWAQPLLSCADWLCICSVWLLLSL